MTTTYTRDELLLARSRAWRSLSPDAVNNVRTFGLRRHRGVHAGCNKQRPIHIVDTRFQSCDRRTLRCRLADKQMRTTQSAGHSDSDGTDKILGLSHVDRNERVRRVLHSIQRVTVPLSVNFGVINDHSIGLYIQQTNQSADGRPHNLIKNSTCRPDIARQCRRVQRGYGPQQVGQHLRLDLVLQPTTRCRR